MKYLSLLLLAFLVHQAPAQTTFDHHWKWNNNDSRLEVDLEGDILFARDYRSVESMSRDALIRIERRERRRDRDLKIERKGGEIVYEYRREGKRIPYDQAREEIGDFLLSVVRDGGLDAERRVGILLEDGGVSAVMAEVRLVESGSGAGRYLSELVRQADLDTDELEEVAALAASHVPSSGDRSRLLMLAADDFQGSRATESAWMKAASSIPSSGDRSRALMRAIDAGMNIQATAGIISGIPSSGDKTRVILHGLKSNPSPDAVAALVNASQTISSSGDRTRALLAASPHISESSAVRQAFVSSARSISSSGDKARLLLRVFQGDQLSQDVLIDALGVATTISSSGDRARVLVAASRHVDGEAAERAYLDAAEGISGSSDRSRALRALISGS
ncbi:MAG: hypothetical protein HKN29_03430 [Rhodothermales bacterium]|nr:hypothetical protein [Rhodothermales bacterium]